MGRLCKAGIGLILILMYHYTYYQGVRIYTNIKSEEGRNISEDGYNLGKKWQCVEFVKRFYYEKYGHKMTNSYGHAISFFDPSIKYKGLNKQRGLIQINNNKNNTPQKNDIIVLKTNTQYGHIAIVVDTYKNYTIIAQQNSLLKYNLIKIDDKVVCWLRKPN